MTVSRNDAAGFDHRRRVTRLALPGLSVMALLALPVVGLAQTGSRSDVVTDPAPSPSAITPGPSAAPADGSLGLSPPGAGPAPAGPRAVAAPMALAPARSLKAVRPANAVGGEGGVQVDALDGVDPESVGTLGADNGGLGLTLWQGTDRAFVRALLAQLPVKTPSPALRDLMRRLLLSAAVPPMDMSEAASGTDGTSLISLRVHQLAGMGDVAAVGDLLAAVPGNVTDPQLLQVEADARFLANDNARACGIAAQQIAVQESPYWQKAMIFCQILAGQPAKAELGLSMLGEFGVEAPQFMTVADQLLGGGSTRLSSIAGADGLLLAMVRAAKVPLPADAGRSDRPGVLRAIAVNPNIAAEIRLEAAERAEAAGALGTDALRQLYSSVQFEAGDLSRPLSRAKEIGGPRARALLYHAALSQSIPTAQAEIVSRALEIAVAEGRYGAAARVFRPLVAKIPPSAALLWFAPDAVRLMLSDNDPEGARNWFQLLQASALFHENSAAELVRLTPLVRLVGTMGLEKEPRALDAWWRAVQGQPGAAARAALLYGLLEGLGEAVPWAVWRALPVSPAKAPTERSAAAPARETPEASESVQAVDAATPMPDTTGQTDPAVLFRLTAVTARVEEFIVQHGAQDRVLAETAADLVAGAVESPVDVAGPAMAAAPIDAEETLDAAPLDLPHRGEIALLALATLGNLGPTAPAPLLRQAVTSLRIAGLDETARALALEAALAAGL